MASSWLTVRQARAAIAADRPDEAHRLLAPLLSAGYRRAWKVAREVAAAHVRRAERFLRSDRPDAAWDELLAAEGLNAGEPTAAALRDTLTRYGLAVVRAALEAGKPLAAIEAAERLRGRGVRHPDLGPLVEAAQDWYLAAETAARGEFLLSAANLERVRPRLAGPHTGLDRFAAEVGGRHEAFRHALGGLHEAVEAQRWRDAIRCADAALAAAPRHRPARLLRSKAWERLHPETRAHVPAEGLVEAWAAVAAGPAPDDRRNSPLPFAPAEDDEPPLRRLPRGADGARANGNASGHEPPSDSSASRPSSPGVPKRFLLWVNNAGGYLVCLSSRVTFGQATADGPIDVPLLADVSRLHAELTRDAEGYVLETQRAVTVNGRAVTRAALAPGDRVTLGPSCQFVFHRPSPISPTALLQFVSGHHFPLAVHGVLLMAETLVLDGGAGGHVSVPGLATAVVLYRGRDGLEVAYPGPFRVENRPCRDRAPLPIPGWAHGEGFGFGLEPA